MEGTAVLAEGEGVARGLRGRGGKWNINIKI